MKILAGKITNNINKKSSPSKKGLQIYEQFI